MLKQEFLFRLRSLKNSSHFLKKKSEAVLCKHESGRVGVMTVFLLPIHDLFSLLMKYISPARRDGALQQQAYRRNEYVCGEREGKKLPAIRT